MTKFGIIPACAGSTRRHLTVTRDGWDHPRMRGEHQPQRSQALHALGSSPHARGAHAKIRAVWDTPRIIPACAGSTNRHDVY